MIDKLIDTPTKKRLKLLLIVGLIALVIVFPIMNILSSMSNMPVSFIESQLSFSGETMKGYYATMSSEELDLYRIVAFLDYGFMVSYGLLIFCGALLISRGFEDDSLGAVSGRLVAVGGVLAACLDGTENVFILLMLTDPLGFPDIWAIIHSIFALIKFILLFTAIFWIILTPIIRKIAR